MRRIRNRQLVYNMANLNRRFFHLFVTLFLHPTGPFQLSRFHPINMEQNGTVNQRITLVFRFVSSSITVRHRLRHNARTRVIGQHFLIVGFMVVNTRVEISIGLVQSLFLRLLRRFGQRIIVNRISFTTAMTIGINRFKKSQRVNRVIGRNFHIVPMLEIALGSSAFIGRPIFRLVNTITSSVNELHPFVTRFFGRYFQC